MSRKVFPFQVDPSQVIENAGTTGEAKWQANLLLGYTNGPWSASWRTRYLDQVNRFTPQQIEDNPDRSNIMTFGTYFQTDIRGGYTFDNNLIFEMGVDNVFDRSLPPYTRGAGRSSASYDNIGRLYYASLTYSF